MQYRDYCLKCKRESPIKGIGTCNRLTIQKTRVKEKTPLRALIKQFFAAMIENYIVQKCQCYKSSLHNLDVSGKTGHIQVISFLGIISFLTDFICG